jgi:hypothetical protein
MAKRRYRANPPVVAGLPTLQVSHTLTDDVSPLPHHLLGRDTIFFFDNGEKVPTFPSKEVRANTNCYITLLNEGTYPSTQPHTNTLKVFKLNKTSEMITRQSY